MVLRVKCFLFSSLLCWITCGIVVSGTYQAHYKCKTVLMFLCCQCSGSVMFSAYYEQWTVGVNEPHSRYIRIQGKVWIWDKRLEGDNITQMPMFKNKKRVMACSKKVSTSMFFVVSLFQHDTLKFKKKENLIILIIVLFKLKGLCLFLPIILFKCHGCVDTQDSTTQCFLQITWLFQLII